MTIIIIESVCNIYTKVHFCVVLQTKSRRCVLCVIIFINILGCLDYATAYFNVINIMKY